MADPIAGYGKIKKWLAFGERAEKHGLVILDEGADELQPFIDQPEKLARVVAFLKAGAPEWQVKSLPDIDWALTCQKLGKEAEYAEYVKMANWSDPNLWVIPSFLRNISCNLVVAKMKADGVKFWQWHDDIDANLEPSEAPTGSVGFLRTVEADEVNKNKSARTLWAENHLGISLPERLVLEAGYFWTTGQHLDVQNITLCAGSRYRDGHIPSVDFNTYHGKVSVYRYHPDYDRAYLRSRSAVPQPR